VNLAKVLFGVKELKQYKYQIIKMFFGGTFAPIGVDCEDKNLIKALEKYASGYIIDTSGCFIDMIKDGVLLGLGYAEDEKEYDGYITINVSIFGNTEGIIVN